MEYAWNTHGTGMEYVWDMYGMRMENAWNLINPNTSPQYWNSVWNM